MMENIEWKNTKEELRKGFLKEMPKRIIEGVKYTYADYLEDFITKKSVKKEYCGCKKPFPNYPEMVWCDLCGKYLHEKQAE